MSQAVYILGGEQTDFQRNWAKEGKSFFPMMKEVVEDALRSTDLDYDDLRKVNSDNRCALFVGNFNAEQYVNQGHLGAFFTEIDSVFYGMPSARYEAACASGAVAIDAAATKIRAGEYDLAFVLGIEIMKTVTSIVGGDFLGTAAYYEKEGKGIEYPFPKLFGKLADVIKKKYNLPNQLFNDALAEISAINYSNAKNNPKAQTRSWFINKRHSMNRDSEYNCAVGGGLAISDCSQITDGAAAVLLCSEKYLKEYSAKRQINKETVPFIKGWGHRVAPLTMDAKMRDARTHAYALPWTRQTIEDAYRRANLTVDDINTFEAHDCFTSSEFAMISSFGITRPGEEIKAINSGIIARDGSKPINPSGGLIGIGHPVGATGVRMLLDLYKQITGRAGDSQVNNVRNGLMLNIGGSATTNIAFIVGK
ncbi:MAG: thiolase domain-containing protein [Candidatus Electrothrix sp. AR3]|nr:thiolase domain-containing protein [Candidatus Electrothrix sp. AR3]